MELKSDFLVISDKSETENIIRTIVQQENSVKKLVKIVELIKLPVTLVLEQYYVDKVYRDMYYRYYSSKHFTYNRNCKRLSIFEGNMTKEEIYAKYEKNELENNFIGTIVIRPLEIGEIGRTILNPFKLQLQPLYIRTTTFEVEVLGMLLMTEAFPFSEQDAEIMTCAETTIWAIAEYYGTRYPEYRVFLPSEILDAVDEMISQRVIPSDGLDYYTVSNVLKKCGFQPRVYAEKSFTEEKYKRIFHYYVESGIPIGVGTTIEELNAGHSTVCVGHAASNYALNGKLENKGGLYVFNSCGFYDKYVMIDDNQIPYTVEKYGDFTLYNAIMDVYVIPLYKRIVLEADKADIIFDNILNVLNDIIKDILDNYEILNSKNAPMITRIFLTSSRKFKAYRSLNARTSEEAEFYREMLYPKFLWVMELSTYTLYKQEKILGEVVLDATSAQGKWAEYIISMRIVDYVGYRLPDETFENLLDRFVISSNGFNNAYDLYKNNLK